MLARTHLAFGILVYLLIERFIGNGILLLSAVLFFSIFPDIDYYNSAVGKKAKPLSYILNLIFGHRGIFHTIYFPILCFLLISYVDIQVAIAMSAGYLSHLFLDSVTLSGTRPLYPLFNKELKGLIKTGGFSETIVFLIITGAVFFFLIGLLS